MLRTTTTAVVMSAVRRVARASSGGSSNEPLKRTPLYELHAEAGAKFVPFCGWEMPVQYTSTGGVKREIAACRNGAVIFDVSHMGQVRIHGPDRHRFIEKVTVADMENTPVGVLRYTIVPNPRGGCIDDAVVAKLPDHLHLVINSACFEKDMKHFAGFFSEFPGLQMEPLYDTHALVAIQGPKAARAVGSLLTPEDAAKMAKLQFMSRMFATIHGVPVILSRCGYTGEDGFEISIPIANAPDIVRRMAKLPDVAYAGLGARDSLRLEAALSLYGHDLSDDITLVEAGQAWTVSKRRREKGGFIGAETILKQIREGVKRKRIGLITEGAPARDGSTVHTKDGKKIGVVTSGGPAPTINKNIGMAFVDAKFTKVDTELLVNVRNKMQPARIVKMPFFPHRYR